MSKKVVVLLSGGMDSTTLLYFLRNSGFDCFPLTISYGQSHAKEILAARNVCEKLGLILSWKLVNMDCLKTLLPSALTGVGKVPEGQYDDSSMSQTVVPGRNLIFLAVAAGYAQGLGAGGVAYAAHSGDHSIYPDCRPEFIQSAAEAVRLGYEIDLLTPFSGIDKTEMVRIGSKLEVPYWMTWSCYVGGEYHCGKCGTCDERKDAFVKAGVSDPTVYNKL